MGVYLVTGTSAGIGVEIAKNILKSEANHVIGVSRRSSTITSKNYTHIAGDLTDAKVQSEVVKAVGPKLDGVVMNAGLLDAVTAIRNLDTDLAAFRKVFDINYFSVVALTSQLIPALKAAHGRAIFVSSGAATNGYQAWAAYGSSKAALNLFVSTLAVEEPEITSVSVAPGVVDTDMQVLIRTQHAGKGQMGTAESEKFLQLKKEGKLVDPKDSGVLYSNLVQHVSHDLSGQYLRYNDPKLAKWASDV